MSDIEALRQMLARADIASGGDSTSIEVQVGRFAVVFGFDQDGLNAILVRDEDAPQTNTTVIGRGD